MAEEKSTKQRQKKPSALKRDIQAEKSRLRNRSFRAKVHTAVRSFEQSISQKEEGGLLQEKLKTVCSLMDKGVKKKVYKLQAAARTKSRLTRRLNSN